MVRLDIQTVTLRHISMPLLNPFTTSFGTLHEREFIAVEVTDSEGRSGWGESVAFVEPSYNEETLKGNWHLLEKFLIPLLRQAKIGHPSGLADLFSRIRGNRMAKAALETACWDLYAKRQNLPLAAVIGGTKASIEVGVSIGIKSSLEQLLDTIGRRIDDGYKRIKIKIKPGWDIGIVDGVRRKYPDIPLMVDANSAYTLADTEHLRQLDDYRLMMIEQPLAYDDLVDHRELQRQLRTPICLDESIHSADDARKAIELGSCRIINIKTGRVGGLTEAIKLHNLCAERQIPVWCGGMLESGIGRAHNIALSALSNFTLPGDTAASSNYWEEDIVDPMVTMRDGQISVPDGPGIGYGINLERLAKYTLYREQFPV
ncbi:o-succinylbenzoate synthase [Paenibacillus contaminans]|uniref:o-succinylbenzoate synthase n=1 Tax=Paenibacillus contaminans TaxID=450362 RepID=A0A329MMY9_9BACL|nr:o-succinylbenzoate synthase [Paenibacillus contaminans]